MISRLELTKGSRSAVICGVKHTGKKVFYNEIQQAIDCSVREGYLFFYEGVRQDDSTPLISRNSERLMTFWTTMIGKGYPYLGSVRGWETQNDTLVYPQDGINADISYQEMANEMSKAGVKCSRMLLYFINTILVKKPNSVSEYPFPLRVITFIGGKRISSWIKASLDLLLQNSRRITVDHRNAKIFEIVLNKSGQRNIFLLYGENHLPGLLKHFKENGWKTK